MQEKQRQNLIQFAKSKLQKEGLDESNFDINAEIDSSISYAENLRIINEKLISLVGITKKDLLISGKELVEAEFKKEVARIEQQAKLQFEKEIEKIVHTKTSENLEKLYLAPREFIKMVVEGRSRGLLLYGEAGLGKSFNVKRVLGEHHLKEGEDFAFICGHITPLQFYKKLYANQNKIVVLDDINILESKINLNMLKASLNDNIGKIEYHTTTKMDIPSSFIFSGKVIILLNDKPKNCEHLKAVESRILTYHLNMSYEQKIATLFDITKLDYKGLELDERLDIAKWIKGNTNEATKNLSIRLLFMCFEFYKHNKELWKDLAKLYVQNDEYYSLIIENCSDDEWIEKTGTGLKTKQRIRAELGLTRGYRK